MESQTPRKPLFEQRLKVAFWLMAVTGGIAATLDLIQDKDVMRAVSGYSLVVAFVLIATVESDPPRFKKILIYAFLVLSILLTVSRWFTR
jgi:hypothetical protein